MTITITDEIKETLKLSIEVQKSFLSSEKTTEFFNNIRETKSEDFTDDLKESVITIIESFRNLVITDVDIIETLITENEES